MNVNECLIVQPEMVLLCWSWSSSACRFSEPVLVRGVQTQGRGWQDGGSGYPCGRRSACTRDTCAFSPWVASARSGDCGTNSGGDAAVASACIVGNLIKLATLEIYQFRDAYRQFTTYVANFENLTRWLYMLNYILSLDSSTFKRWTKRLSNVKNY